MSITARKYHLIEGIMQVSEIEAIEKLEQVLKQYSLADESIKHLVKPMKEKLDIDQLVKEQNYKGLSAEKVDQLIEAIGIEEPIEDLLKMI